MRSRQFELNSLRATARYNYELSEAQLADFARFELGDRSDGERYSPRAVIRTVRHLLDSDKPADPADHRGAAQREARRLVASAVLDWAAVLVERRGRA